MLAMMSSCWRARLCTSVYKQWPHGFVFGSRWSPARLICDARRVNRQLAVVTALDAVKTRERNRR